MMKKAIFITALAALVLFPQNDSQGITYLKLRTHDHPKFLRIVLEGTESIVSSGMVNQRGKDIIVRFPHADLVVSGKTVQVPYRIEKNVVIFSPGLFSRFKVMTLKHPNRLVIDVYHPLQEERGELSLEAIRRRLWRERESDPRTELYGRIPEKEEVRIVVIDPGHGGYEAGVIGEGHKEKNVVLDIGKRLEAMINRGSKQSFLTRKSDQFISLEERVKFTNSKAADVFLSLHVGKHSGIVLYTPVVTDEMPFEVRNFLARRGQKTYLKRTEALHDTLREAIMQEFGRDKVVTRALPHSILSDIEAAALLIEVPSFEDTDDVDAFNKKFANTLYKGLSLYEENR